MKLTTKQVETFKTAKTIINEMGGPAMITSRNREKAVRESLKTDGTYYWALVQAYQINGIDEKFSDEYCDYLQGIIKAGA